MPPDNEERRHSAGGGARDAAETSGTILAVPDITGMDMLAAALAYAEHGWYVLPVKPGTKDPGSVVGAKWQLQSSRDPRQIAAWYAGTSDGIALHAGRSGAVILDVDNVPALNDCPPLLAAIEECHRQHTPVQRTGPGRAHYPYLQPPGRHLGNSKGKLAGGWGEVRGRNGVILAEPTVHPEGRRYEWLAAGPVPALPGAIGGLLPDAGPATDAATDAEVAAFTAAHTASSRPWLLTGVLTAYREKTSRGESRHETALSCTVWAAKEARAGYYRAGPAFTAIGDLFRQSLNGDTARSPASEYAGILAWAVGQANAADLDEVRRIAEQNDAKPFTGTPLTGLTAYIEQLRARMARPARPAHVLLVLAAAAARAATGEPLWLLLVAPGPHPARPRRSASSAAAAPPRRTPPACSAGPAAANPTRPVSSPASATAPGHRRGPVHPARQFRPRLPG